MLFGLLLGLLRSVLCGLGGFIGGLEPMRGYVSTIQTESMFNLGTIAFHLIRVMHIWDLHSL